MADRSHGGFAPAPPAEPSGPHPLRLDFARRPARGTPPEAHAAGGWFRRSGCDNPRTVLEHWEAWGTRDEHAIMSYFSDDAIYHNIPVAPIVGAVAIRATVRAFLQLFVSVQIETLAMASHDEVVHTERINHFQVFNGNVVALPVAGALYLSRGLIYLWRDYFDLASFETQSGVKLG